jgi:WD40 repeat protein
MNTCRLLLFLTLGWLLASATANPGDELPSDAAKRVKEFEGEQEAIQKKADVDIKARRGKLIEDLQALQEGYTKAGKLDEAVAIRERIRQLKADLGENYAIEIRRLEGHTGHVVMVAFSSDGQTLASSAEDGTARLWNWKTGKLLATLDGHKGGVLHAKFSPDGKTLVTASRDNTAILWDPVKKEKRTTLDEHTSHVHAALFSPNGKTLATASGDSVVILREPSGKVRRKLEGHSQGLVDLAYSPDGRTLVSSGGNWNDPGKGGEVKAWDLDSGKELWTAAGEFGGIWGVAFAPDAKSVAGASLDGTVRIWEAATGKELYVLKGHTDRARHLAYSPSRKTLASTSADGTIRLWDTTTGKEKAVLRGHTGWVQGVAFSPDGRVLATASVDQTVRIWQLGKLDEQTGLFGR